MRLQRYRFEQVVQEANSNTVQWLKEEFKTILESNKEFTRKADYIGFSINSIDDKVKVLDEEIKELQLYKSKLKEAKEVVITVGAEVFSEYGISKIEGAGISSITLTKPKESSKTVLSVSDEQGLIDAGFYKKVVDDKAVLESFNNGNYESTILRYAKIETIITTTPEKLKVNKRRVTVPLKQIS